MTVYAVPFYTMSDSTTEILVSAESEQEAIELSRAHAYFGQDIPGAVRCIQRPTLDAKEVAAIMTARLLAAKMARLIDGL